MVEEGLGAAGEFVECGAGGGDVVGGFGDGVSCGAAVEASGVGEVAFGLSVSLFGVVEVAGDGGDGVVVGCAAVFEVGELSGELVDAVLDVRRLLGCWCVDVGVGVGEFVCGRRGGGRGTSRGSRIAVVSAGVGWGGGGEFASGAGGGVVGAVGGEDVFEDVDGVGDVVGVGGDADEVLVLAAGDGDVEPAAGGGGGGEGDRARWRCRIGCRVRWRRSRAGRVR